MKAHKVSVIIEERLYTMVLNEEFNTHDEAVDYVLKYLKKPHSNLCIRWCRNQKVLFDYNRLEGISKGMCSDYLNNLLKEEYNNEN